MENNENAVWETTAAGATAHGACIEENGWTGTAVRECTPAAVWGKVTTPCKKKVDPCPAIVGSGSAPHWPQTPAGTTATGSCTTGYVSEDSSAPQRFCTENGTWSDEFVGCKLGTWGWILFDKPRLLC